MHLDVAPALLPATITVTPSPLAASAAAGGAAVTLPVQVRNDGDLALDWNAIEAPATRPSAIPAPQPQSAWSVRKQRANDATRDRWRGHARDFVSLPHDADQGCDAATPGFVFCSVGQVVFIAPLVLGLLTWYVLALWNVRATLWALAAAVAVWAGLVSATSLVSQTLPTWLASLSSLTSFGLSWPSIAAQAGGMGVNAFLAALGLGAFGRPASQRFAGAWLASILCVVLGHALAPIGWPYFTLPFNLAVWTVLAVSRAQPSPESA